jgi:nucleotide-binding universal stress UspA family protein
VQDQNGIRGNAILVPTDFSRNAESALRYAIGLAEDLKASLIILHSYRLLQTAVPSVDQSPFSIKNQWDKDTWEKFRNIENNIIKDSKIKYDFEVDVGFASDAIISSVEANDIGMVVMGAAGAGAMSQVLGSTTLKIIDKVRCPVLVVPSNAEYNGVKNVTFAFDNKKIKEQTNLELLFGYMREFNAQLEVLNINSEDLQKPKYMESLEESLNSLSYSFTSIHSGDVAEGILNYLKGKDTDMLIALKRDHGFMEKVFRHSVTRKLVLHTELPLMVLHES